MDDLEVSEIAPARNKKPSFLEDLGLDGELTPLALMRLVDAQTGSKLRGQSVRAFERRFANQAVALGPRRKGFRLHVVLELPAPKLPK
jgi:hypothetical protein